MRLQSMNFISQRLSVNNGDDICAQTAHIAPWRPEASFVMAVVGARSPVEEQVDLIGLMMVRGEWCT